MTRLRISGRGKLVAEAFVDAAGVTLRVDDDRDPEFWAEVRLSIADVRYLLMVLQDAEVLAAGEAGRTDPC